MAERKAVGRTRRNPRRVKRASKKPETDTFEGHDCGDERDDRACGSRASAGPGEGSGAVAASSWMDGSQLKSSVSDGAASVSPTIASADPSRYAPWSTVEYRVDSSDPRGYEYSKEEFVAFYGGTEQWDMAAPTGQCRAQGTFRAPVARPPPPTPGGDVACDGGSEQRAPDGCSSSLAEAAVPSLKLDRPAGGSCEASVAGLQVSAGPSPPLYAPWSTGVEYRVDRDDPRGYEYTREEFVAFYGGTKEWDAAVPTLRRHSASAPARRPPPPGSSSAGGRRAAEWPCQTAQTAELQASRAVAESGRPRPIHPFGWVASGVLRFVNEQGGATTSRRSHRAGAPVSRQDAASSAPRPRASGSARNARGATATRGQQRQEAPPVKI